MPTAISPYITRNPRDLITAEDWNQMQILIRQDILTQIQKSLAELQSVPKSGDSGKLEGKTRLELEQEIIDAATQMLNKRTGYMRIFKKLTNTEVLIKHGLKDFPVVDVYELQAFNVICSEDDIKDAHKAFFYLYHSSEKSIKTKVDSASIDGVVAGGIATVDIETAKSGTWKIPFETMLNLYGVKYDGDSSLDDLVTDFWQAFFEAPNDRFDAEDYCRSPWFDRCCGERRTVNDLKKRGEWNEIWFHTRPFKIAETTDLVNLSHPPDIKIAQHDFDTIGASAVQPGTAAAPTVVAVMLLLKV